MHESGNRDYYSRDSSTYESTRFSTPSGRDDHDRLMACIATLSASLDLSNVVEVGVGTGRVTRVLLAEAAESITCVDIAPEMLRVAAEHTDSNRVRYVEGSAYSLPLATGEYSSFVSVNLLSHLDDLNMFWHEAARVLRRGGLALVTSPKVDSLFLPFGLVTNFRGTAYGEDVHSVWHRRKTQLRAINAAGGTVRSIVGHYYTPRALGGGSIGRVFHRCMSWADRLPPRFGDRLAPMDIYLVEF